MNILITGANGRLGNEVRALSAENGQHIYFSTDVQELNICDGQATCAFVSGNRVDITVNYAAHTAVDKAEDNPELCDKLNHVAPDYLAAAAEACGAAMIQVSTDYVFDETEHIPYTEDTTPCPNFVYGSTKLVGEQAAGKKCNRVMIVRTARLYSIYGNNFVETTICLSNEYEKLGVAFDQTGTSTYANGLARAIFAAISQGVVPGVRHFSDEDVCSRYDFTVAIHRMAGITPCKVSPLHTDEYPAKTPCPRYFVLDKTKIKKTFSIETPHWGESLQVCIDKLVQQTD